MLSSAADAGLGAYRPVRAPGGAGARGPESPRPGPRRAPPGAVRVGAVARRPGRENCGVERERHLIQHPRCPFCHDAVAPEDEKAACAACMAWHHRECWAEAGACGACSSPRSVESVAGERVAPELNAETHAAPVTRLASSDLDRCVTPGCNMLHVRGRRRRSRCPKCHAARLKRFALALALVAALVAAFMS